MRSCRSAACRRRSADENRLWRRVIADAIRNDPEWKGGNYVNAATEPEDGAADAVSGQQQFRPSAADDAHARGKRRRHRRRCQSGIKNYDANDLLYAIEASWDYDPGPSLEKIRAPLFAIKLRRRSHQSA
jgi:homoserine O-acetyltransferase